MKWRKTTGKDLWTVQAGPYLVTIEATGDGRFKWSIISGDKPNPEATGVGNSLGAAKNSCENFVKRSGHV